METGNQDTASIAMTGTMLPPPGVLILLMAFTSAGMARGLGLGPGRASHGVYEGDAAPASLTSPFFRDFEVGGKAWLFFSWLLPAFLNSWLRCPCLR